MTLRSATTACVILVFLLAAAPAAAQKPEDDVLKVVNSLFEGMRKKDTVMMRAALAPNARLISTGTANGAPTVREVPIANWITSVSRATSDLDERIFNPEVRVSDNLASVWVRYELWVGANFSHCGYDAFQLVRTADGWKIVQVADTQRRERETCTR